LFVAVGLVFVANTLNVGADLGAMAAAVQLFVPGVPFLLLLALLSFGILALEVLVAYRRYAVVLKLLALSLLAYVATAFIIGPRGGALLRATVLPTIQFTPAFLALVVGVLGTTISPYLFFWQSSQEVEEEEADPKAAPLLEKPRQAPRELQRIGWETWIGMGMSNTVAFFIIMTTAATLHAHGQTDIQSTEQAAEALKPIAGNAAFILFSIGIIGTGLLAVPVLAGSVAYAAGELFAWPTGLEHPPGEARGFYAVIAAAIVLGVGVDLSGLDPIKALVWSAVVNGVAVVPVLVAMMIVSSRPAQMGKFVASRGQRIFGWITTLMMAAAAVAMFATM
jgi:Mn2+/Fe2+ NRAMP family transporter